MNNNLMKVIASLFITAGLMVACADDRSVASKVSLEKENNAGAVSKIIFLGDGITAGADQVYEDTYPYLLEQLLDQAEYAAKVVNAGIKGETAAQANGRIEWLLQQRFQVFVLALGWDDQLAGVPFSDTRQAIEEMLAKLKRSAPQAQVILLAPPLDESRKNDATGLKELATAADALYCPHPLPTPEQAPALWSEDGRYPNRDGQRRMAEGLAEFLTREL